MHQRIGSHAGFKPPILSPARSSPLPPRFSISFLASCDLGKSAGAVQPHQRILDAKSGVLQPHPQSVPSSGSTETQKTAAGL